MSPHDQGGRNPAYNGTVRPSLAVAAPVFLLAAGVLADRVIHHAPAPSAPPAPSDRIDDLISGVRTWCAGPEGLENCAPEAFVATFRINLPALVGENRRALERRWLADLADGDHAAAYGLAWLGTRRALPVLRQRLLSERYFYGWETSTPDDPATLFANEQYPRHQALILAIERIDGRPLRSAVKLTPDERQRLLDDAARCNGAEAAHWLLHLLDGAPLPSAKENRARRFRCGD